MPREIVVDWITPSGAGKASVFFFTNGNPIGDQRLALATFLGNIDGSLTVGTTWTVRTTGRELDDATGGLVDAWSDATVRTGTGGVGTEPVADSTQVLYQWHTGDIVNGRFLRGRTFIPGLAASNLDSGNLDPAVASGFAGYGTTLISAGVGLGVWHRPQGGAGGQFETTNSCTVWTEFAVLRRRRG